MTGAYMTWTYGPAGWIDDLNACIKDPAKTNSELRLGRRAAGLPRLRPRGTGVPGEPLGVRRRQAMVHSVGLRAELDHL